MAHEPGHEDEYNISADDMLAASQGAYGLQPYQQALGRFQVQAPRLLERSAARERQALEQAQRTGMMSLAEQAAQARAAAMGGAGQMAGGGGRAASMRQGGLSFGRRAADFAADAAQRAAGLEADITNRQLQMMGEALPGAMLAQAEAQRSVQNDVVNLQNYLDVLEDNYSVSERPGQLRAFLATVPAGSPAHQLGMAALARMENRASQLGSALAGAAPSGPSVYNSQTGRFVRPGMPGYEEALAGSTVNSMGTRVYNQFA
jgi:hypothetical protein